MNSMTSYEKEVKAIIDKAKHKIIQLSKATGSRYSVLGFDAGGKKIVDSGWQTGKTYALGKDVVAVYTKVFSIVESSFVVPVRKAS